MFEQPTQKQVASSFGVMIVTQSKGKPVTGAKILSGKEVLGATDQAGKVLLKLEGSEGDAVELLVQCPEGLASPEKPITVGLRVMAPGSPSPRFEAECVPLTHNILVGLRTDKGADLPVLYLDEVVGHTNSAGVAHLRLTVTPKEQVTLTIDTSKKPALRPQNPRITFVTSDKDEMILLEQKFDLLRKKAKPKAKPNIPTPI
jgi:hypothetical protein